MTGLLIYADEYPIFRDRIFRLLPGFDRGVDGLNIEVHASELFRDSSDDVHFEFYAGVVSLVNELSCKVYRRGFNFSPGHRHIRKSQRTQLWYCFRSILFAVLESQVEAQIWPVVELDHTRHQDEHFAGYIRTTDHATAHLEMVGDGARELVEDHQMVDNVRLGDLHYVSKTSIVGSAVDCLSYLLHWKWVRENEGELSIYKQRLADIACALDTASTDDYIGRYR